MKEAKQDNERDSHATTKLSRLQQQHEQQQEKEV